jgi:glutaredoxin
MPRFLTIILIAVCVFAGWKHFGSTATRSARGNLSISELSALAATIKSSDVVMYSTTECIYCAQAKSWLKQYGFAFTECNMSVDAECERQFKNYGADGTPFLMVRGHPMREGFNTDQFIALLSQ